jgi:hypothetical protein
MDKLSSNEVIIPDAIYKKGYKNNFNNPEKPSVTPPRGRYLKIKR